MIFLAKIVHTARQEESNTSLSFLSLSLSLYENRDEACPVLLFLYPGPVLFLIPLFFFSLRPILSSSSKNPVGLTWTPLLITERLIIISFPKTFRDKDKAKGETVALRIEKKKKTASWCVGGASLCRESGAGVAALEPHPCFLDFQQLFFLFYFFFKVQIQMEAGNHEKRSDYGS